MNEIFHLRFTVIGSIYAQPHTGQAGRIEIATEKDSFEIGPVVCTTFVQDPDDDKPRSRVNNPNRGPFNTAGDWLASIAEYELAYTRQYPEEALEESIFVPLNSSSQEEQLQDAQTALEQFIGFVRVSCEPQGSLTDEFAFLHHDLRLSNVYINPDNGDITGIMDWEAAHSAPLWACARLPSWVEDPHCEEVENRLEGESLTKNLSQVDDRADNSPPDITRRLVSVRNDNQKLRDIFLDTVSEQWRMAYEYGRHWRSFQEICSLSWVAWAEPGMKRRIEMYQKQALQHPGFPLVEGSLQPINVHYTN